MIKALLRLPSSFISFLKSVYQEFRLVEKISFSDTLRLTLGVISISATVGLILAVLDKGFILLITKLLAQS